MEQVAPTKAYECLIRDITSLYEQARRALVASYWEIGKRIVEAEGQAGGKAAYGTQLLSRLSRDLQAKLGSGFSIRNLRNMRRFYLDHPNRQPAADLNWSQHVELMPIADAGTKRQFEAHAPIVIQTHKFDKYTRYLADVFYLAGSKQPEAIISRGIHLNQQLLDKGLATPWRGAGG